MAKRIEKCTFRPCDFYRESMCDGTNCALYGNVKDCKVSRYYKALNRVMNANPIAKDVFAIFNQKFKQGMGK